MKRKLIALLLVLCMVLGMAPQAFAGEPETAKATAAEDAATEAVPEGAQSSERALETKELTLTKIDASTITADLILDSAVAELEPTTEEPAHAATDPVRVIIVLDEKAAIGVGYSTAALADNAAALSYIDAQRTAQQKLTTQIEKKALGGKTLDVKWNLTLAMNAIAAEVPYGAIEAIEKVPGVKAVYEDVQYEVPEPVDLPDEPNTVSATEMVGRSAAAELGYTGAGQLIAIIDTGLDTDHSSFDADALLYSLDGRTEGLLDAEGVDTVLAHLNAAQRFEGLTAEQLYLSAKVPYGFNYVDMSLNVTHDYDSQGDHGTHVSGIAAANRYVPAGDGYAEQPNGVVGVAPDAQLLVMKVFGAGGGAYATDYMAAIEDALLLGADAVNLSLGSAYPGFTYANEYINSVMDALVGSDTVVSISCGNNGSWADYTIPGLLYTDGVSMDEVGSPGSYTNSLAVASVNNAAVTGSVLEFNGSYKATYTETTGYGNASILTLDVTGEGTSYDYVLLEGIGVEEDYADVEVAGKVVLVSRGQTNFADKVNIAASHGAVAVVVYNNQDGIINMNLTGVSTTTPAVAITQAAKEAIASQGAAGTVRISGEVATMPAKDGWTMSSFSSWGLPGDLSLKPEITAPGGNIYSSLNNNTYGTMSGTSMAAPSVTGGSAVVTQYIAENGLAEKTGLPARTLAQSLLMASAVPLTDPESGVEYSPRQQGAGLMNVYDAVTAGAYILVGDRDGNDGKVKLELGDDPDRTGEYELAYTIYNFSETDREYVLSASVLAPAVVTVDGEEFMSKSDRALSPSLTWSVSGAYRYDVNGDGAITRADAEALMDFVAGSSDLELDDRYDFNGDGAVNTADVRIYLESLAGDTSLADVFTRAVSVPAGGSLPVTATLILSAEDLAWLEAHYAKGTYVEGYLYATELSGPTLSVPFIAFYGSWTDPSMFDRHTFGVDDNGSYLGETNFITYDPDSKTADYLWPQNLYVRDSYRPERYAVNSETSTVRYFRFSPIRNFAYYRFFMRDADTGEVYSELSTISAFVAAFYYAAGGMWYYTAQQEEPYYRFLQSDGRTPLPEGTRVELGLTLLPEYYLNDDGELDPEKTPGPGSTLSYTFTVDNTPPELLGVTGSYDLLTGELAGDMTLRVRDNRYIAGVVILNEFGDQVLARYAADGQTEPGELIEGEIPVPETDLEEGFMILVGDYAGNETAYLVSPSASSGSGKLQLETGVVYGLTYGEGHSAIVSLDLEPDGEGFVQMETLGRLSRNDYTSAVYADGYLYAISEYYQSGFESNRYQPAIYAIDPVTRAENFVAEIPAADRSMQAYHGMAYDPDSDRIYVASNTGTGGGLISWFTPSEGILHELAPLKSGTGTRYSVYGMTRRADGTFYALCRNSDNSLTLVTFRVEDEALADVTSLELDVESPESSSIYELFGFSSYYSHFQLIWQDDTLLVSAYMQEAFETNAYWDNSIKPIAFWSWSAEDGSMLRWIGGTERALAALWQYGGSDDSVSGITLSSDSLTMVAGQNKRLSALVSPWTAGDKTLLWSSSDENVATVDGDGVISALGAGTTVITAVSLSNPEVSASCSVLVLDKDFHAVAFVVEENGAMYWATWSLTEGFRKLADSESTYTSAALVGGYVYAYNAETKYVEQLDPVTFACVGQSKQTYDGLAEITGGGSRNYLNVLWETGGYYGALDGYVVPDWRYATLHEWGTGSEHTGAVYTNTRTSSSYQIDSHYIVDATGCLGYIDVYGGFGDNACLIHGSYPTSSDHSMTVDTSLNQRFSALTYDFENGYLLYAFYNGTETHMEVMEAAAKPSNSQITGRSWLCLGSLGAGIKYVPAMLPLSTYTISFDSQGGSPVEDQTIPTVGQRLEKPEDPTRTGWTFTGWYRDAACTQPFDFENDAMGDGTLYAGWSVAEGYCAVSFETFGGTAIALQSVAPGRLAIRPEDEPARAYSTFTDWYADEACTELFDFSKPIYTDTTIYAGYDVESFTVTFDTDGGSEIEPIQVPYQDLIPRPEDPTKEGYSFDGWYSNSLRTVPFDFETTRMGGKNLTIYARWHENSLTYVYFDATNGDDENDGSRYYPVKTLDRALALLPAASTNTIVLKTGLTVTEPLTIDGEGIEDLTLAVPADGVFYNLVTVSGQEASLTLKHVRLDGGSATHCLSVLNGASAFLLEGTSIRSSNTAVDIGGGTLTVDGAFLGDGDVLPSTGLNVSGGLAVLESGTVRATGIAISAGGASSIVTVNGGTVNGGTYGLRTATSAVARITGGQITGGTNSIYCNYNNTRAGLCTLAPAVDGAITLNGPVFAPSYSSNTKSTLKLAGPLSGVNAADEKLRLQVRTWASGAVVAEGADAYIITAEDLARIEVTNPSDTMELALNDSNQIVMQTKASSGDSLAAPGAMTPTLYAPLNLSFRISDRVTGGGIRNTQAENTDCRVASLLAMTENETILLSDDGAATLTLAEAESGICLADVTLSLAQTGMGDNGKVTVTWPEGLTLESAEPGVHLEGSVFVVDTDTPGQLMLYWAKAGTVTEADVLLNLRFTGEAGEYTLHFDVAELGEAVSVENYDLTAELLPEPHVHAYGEPTWTWNEDLTSATAAFTCECGDEQVVAAVITEELVTEALPHVPGEKKLTAAVEFEGETYTDEKTVELDALPCPCAAFEDMPEYGTPEHEAIDWAFTQDPQITTGMSETLFGVGQTLTRGQAATFLYAAAGKPAFDVENAENPFTDVKDGKWYTTPVLWAYSQGLVSGMSADTYGVNGTLTRGQILVILYAWAGKPSVEGLENPYADVPAGKWYTNAAVWAYHAGIERGAEGVYNQSAPCLRETMVLYLYRYLTGNQLLTD